MGEEEDPSRNDSDQASVVRLEYEGIYSELRAACGNPDRNLSDRGEMSSRDPSPQPTQITVPTGDDLIVVVDGDGSAVGKQDDFPPPPLEISDFDCDGTCPEAMKESELVPGCPECEQVCLIETFSPILKLPAVLPL